MSYEKGTELAIVGQPVKAAFEKFAAETGRKLQMEIEPGTFLLANSCALLSTVQDIVATGAHGHDFLKLDSGMTEVLRPSLYGAQHPIVIVKKGGKPATGTKSYVVRTLKPTRAPATHSTSLTHPPFTPANAQRTLIPRWWATAASRATSSPPRRASRRPSPSGLSGRRLSGTSAWWRGAERTAQG